MIDEGLERANARLVLRIVQAASTLFSEDRFRACQQQLMDES